MNAIERSVSVWLLFFALMTGGALIPNDAVAESPERQGFTIGLGLGAGYTTFEPQDVPVDVGTRAGSAVTFEIGGFLTENTAVLFHLTGNTYTGELGSETTTIRQGGGGLYAQHWFTDKLFAGGGMGLAFLQTDIRTETRTADGGRQTVYTFEEREGVGTNIQIGYDIVHSKYHSFQVVAEGTPALIEETFGSGFSLMVKWQYL